MSAKRHDSRSTSITNVATDTIRRAAEGRIRPLRDRVVLVEGKNDEITLRDNCPIPGIKFQHIGKNKGKREIIQKVSEDPDFLGLVDMDYDFDSEEIRLSRNLIDTRGQCCLYSFICMRELEDDFIVNHTIEIIEQLSRDEEYVRLNKDPLISKLKASEKSYIEFVKIRTNAKLYKGRLGRALGSKVQTDGQIGPKWEDILHNSGVEDWVKDLIGKDSLQDFNNFVSINFQTLKGVGIRDHDLCAGVVLLLESQGIATVHLKGRINRQIGKIMRRESGNEVTIYFLSKLGLV